jgi:hypothetical protein
MALILYTVPMKYKFPRYILKRNYEHNNYEIL